MKDIKYIIIGCGRVARVHIHHLLERGIDIVGVCDTSANELDRMRDLFNRDRCYSDYTDMIDQENPDVVSVCTPPYLHKEQVILCAERGISILCEKPLSTNIADAKKMVESCRKNGVTLGVMLPRRFYDNSRAVKKGLESKFLGKIKHVGLVLRCNKGKDYYAIWRGKKFEAGGGVLMSQAIHSIDQLVYFFGKPIKVNGRVQITREYLEVEDEATGEIEFESGIKAKLSATANADELWCGITEIKGEEGEIVLDSAKTVLWDVPDVQPPKEEKEDIPEEIKPIYYGPCHKKVIDDFITAIEKGKRPYVTGEDSLGAMSIIMGIYKSSNRGGKVVDLRELE